MMLSTVSPSQEAGPRPASFATWLGVLWAVLALLLYLRTLAPGVVALDDDTLEFQLVAVRGAIPHPSGYPLYAILLTLAARVLPFGEVAYRANLLSALFAAGAVGVTYYVARRLNMGLVAASSAVLLFAITPTFWAQATVAEVYGLHLLLSALLWWRFLAWLDRINPNNRLISPLLLIPSADVFLVIGLALAHHRMMLLWLPALFLAWLVAVFPLWRQKRIGMGHGTPRPKGTGPETSSPAKKVPQNRFALIPIWRVGIGLVTLLLPLLLYLWLPIRNSVGSIDGTYSQVGFSCWVTACQYTSFFSDNALATARPLSYFWELTLTEISIFGVVLTFIGMTRLIRLPLPKSVLLVVGLLTNAIFGIAYRVPDPEVFWIPTVWVLCVFAGLGVQQLIRQPHPPTPLSTLERGDDWETTTSSLWLEGVRNGIVIIAVAGLLIFLVGTRWTDADRSVLTGNPTLNGIAFNGHDVLNQPLPDDSVVIGLLGEITYLRYLQEATGIAPKVATAGGDSEELRRAALDAALASGQPPFLTRELTGLGEQYSLSALGPLIEVLPQPRIAVPEGLYPLEQPVNDAITLVGWTRSPIMGSDGMERLTVAWRVDATITQNLNVSARVVNNDDSLACDGCQIDTPPVRNAYPTTQWRAGEVIVDTYDLPTVPQGAHYLLIFYNPAAGMEVGRTTITP